MQPAIDSGTETANRHRGPWRALAFLAALALAVPVAADEGHDHGPPAEPASADDGHEAVEVYLIMPQMSAERGMVLFVSKGCVACHAINGVGGHDAVNLDAHDMDHFMNPFEFVAKMWTMAPFMIAAQEEALGGQILFTGEEIADIIAFVHSDEHQHAFTEDIITSEVRAMMNHTHGAPAHQEELGHAHD